MKPYTKLLLLLLSTQAQAKNYYVDPSFAGSSTGTITAPYKTLANVEALALLPGDTVFFKRGKTFTTKANSSFKLTKSGTAAQPIVFTGYGTGANPVFNYDPLATNLLSTRIVFLVTGKYVVLDGLDITDNLNDPNHTTLCRVGYGVQLSGGYGTVKNSSITKIGVCITVNSSFNTIQGNTLRDTRMIRSDATAGNDYGAVGLWLDNASDNVISNNTISDHWAASVDEGWNGNAFELWGSCNRNVIQNNTCTNNEAFLEAGFSSIVPCADNVVAYNLLINNGTLGIFQNSTQRVLITNFRYANNTVIETVKQYNNKAYLFGWSGGASTDQAASNCVVLQDNIFFLNSGVTVVRTFGTLFSAGQVAHTGNVYRTNGSLGFSTTESNQPVNADELFVTSNAGIIQSPYTSDYHLRSSTGAGSYASSAPAATTTTTTNTTRKKKR